MASYAKSMSTCCLKNSKSIVSCIKGLSQGFFATFFGFSNYFYCIPCLFASVCCNDGIAVGVHGNHALFCLGIPVFTPPCKNRLGAAPFVFCTTAPYGGCPGINLFLPFLRPALWCPVGPDASATHGQTLPSCVLSFILYPIAAQLEPAFAKSQLRLFRCLIY